MSVIQEYISYILPCIYASLHPAIITACNGKITVKSPLERIRKTELIVLVSSTVIELSCKVCGKRATIYKQYILFATEIRNIHF
jgi:hypothetical protein